MTWVPLVHLAEMGQLGLVLEWVAKLGHLVWLGCLASLQVTLVALGSNDHPSQSPVLPDA